MTAPKKALPRPPGPGPSYRGVTRAKAPSTLAQKRGMATAKKATRPKAGKKAGASGGIDVGKFASEVSRNYAKGMTQVGGALKGVHADLVSRSKGIGIGRDGGTIDRAMKTGADKNNPLHRILGNDKRK